MRIPLTLEDAAIVGRSLIRIARHSQSHRTLIRALRNAVNDYRERGPDEFKVIHIDIPDVLHGERGAMMLIDELHGMGMFKTPMPSIIIHPGDILMAPRESLIPDIAPFHVERREPQYGTARERREALRRINRGGMGRR